MGSRRSAARAAAAVAMLLRGLHNPEETPSSGGCVWVFSFDCLWFALFYIVYVFIHIIYGAYVPHQSG